MSSLSSVKPATPAPEAGEPLGEQLAGELRAALEAVGEHAHPLEVADPVEPAGVGEEEGGGEASASTASSVTTSGALSLQPSGVLRCSASR